MENLVGSGQGERAWAIKSKLLEICEKGWDYPGLIQSAERPNQFSYHAQPAEGDRGTHPGYRIDFLIIQDRLMVLEVGELAS